MITIFKRFKKNRLLKKCNALDLIPIALVDGETSENGNFQLLVKRFEISFFKNIFRKTEYFNVKLDATGSKTWKLIDGKKTIAEIVSILESESNSNENFPERVVAFITDLFRKELVNLVIKNNN